MKNQKAYDVTHMTNEIDANEEKYSPRDNENNILKVTEMNKHSWI